MDKFAENDPKAPLGECRCHCRRTSELNIRQDLWELGTKETQTPVYRIVKLGVTTPPESPPVCVDHQVMNHHGSDDRIVRIQFPATAYESSTGNRRVIREETRIGGEGDTQALEAIAQRRAIELPGNNTIPLDHRQQMNIDAIDAEWKFDMGQDEGIFVCKDEFTDTSSSQGSSIASDDLYASPEDDKSLAMTQNQYSPSVTMRPGLGGAKEKGSSETSGHSGRSSSVKRRHDEAPADVASYQDDQSDQEDQHVRKRARRQESDDASALLLACPFFKRDRQKYQKCLHYQLKRIKDVKQHLKRQHSQPAFYCARCCTIFGSANNRDLHARSQQCEVVSVPKFDGVSVEQMKRLNQQYVSRGKSTSEQWYDMWDILFPNTTRPPSVYVSNCVEEVIEILQSNWETRSGEIMAQVAESINLKIDSQLLGQLFPLILNSLAKSSGSTSGYNFPTTFANSPEISGPACCYEGGSAQADTGALPSVKFGQAGNPDFTGIVDWSSTLKIGEDSSQIGVTGEADFDWDFSWNNSDDIVLDFTFTGEQ